MDFHFLLCIYTVVLLVAVFVQGVQNTLFDLNQSSCVCNRHLLMDFFLIGSFQY